MERTKTVKYSLAAIIISVSLAAIIITVGLILSGRKKNPESWILHSYGNNVALYSGEEIVEVYGSIMLDTLPADDKRQLDSGIVFPTKEEAISAIEDYDG